MQRVQSLSSARFGITVVMAYLGHVAFDAQGISKEKFDATLVEKAEEAYDDLVAVDLEDEEVQPPVIPPTDPIKPQVEEDDLSKTDEDDDRLEDEDEEDELGDEEGELEDTASETAENSLPENQPATTEEHPEGEVDIEQMIASLEGKSLEELREIASDAGFPEGEWKPFRAQKNLKNYIIEKLKQ